MEIHGFLASKYFSLQASLQIVVYLLFADIHTDTLSLYFKKKFFSHFGIGDDKSD